MNTQYTALTPDQRELLQMADQVLHAGGLPESTSGISTVALQSASDPTATFEGLRQSLLFGGILSIDQGSVALPRHNAQRPGETVALDTLAPTGVSVGAYGANYTEQGEYTHPVEPADVHGGYRILEIVVAFSGLLTRKFVVGANTSRPAQRDAYQWVLAVTDSRHDNAYLLRNQDAPAADKTPAAFRQFLGLAATVLAART